MGGGPQIELEDGAASVAAALGHRATAQIHSVKVIVGVEQVAIRAVAVDIERLEIVQRDIRPRGAVRYQLIERAAAVCSTARGSAVESAVRRQNETAVRKRCRGGAVELVDLRVDRSAVDELDRPGRAVAVGVAAMCCRAVDRSVGAERQSTFGIGAVGGAADLIRAQEVVKHLIGAADRHSPDDTLIGGPTAELGAVDRTILAEDDHSLRSAVEASVEVVEDLERVAATGAQAIEDAGAVRAVGTCRPGAAGSPWCRKWSHC